MRYTIPDRAFVILAAVYAALVVMDSPRLAAQEPQLLPGPAVYKPELRSVVRQASATLQWYYFEGANLFRVQAAVTDTFEQVFLDDTTRYHYYMLTDLPLDGTRIFWRVRACNLSARDEESPLEDMVCLSEWSPPYSFFSGRPNNDPDDADNGSDTPGIIDNLLDCVGVNLPGSGKVLWRNYLPLFLAMALAGQFRIPRGKG